MSNKLEDFITNNRDEFDDARPGNNNWEKIEQSLTASEEPKIVRPKFGNWAAAAALLAIVSLLLVLQFGKKDKGPEVIVKAEPDINSIAPEYAPQVNQFAKMINGKQEELKTLSKEQPELYQKFTTDIIQLDSSYDALQQQLRVSPNKEMLIEAMIQNLQLQLNVLNQQLNIINQIKKTKKYSHEKVFKTI